MRIERMKKKIYMKKDNEITVTNNCMAIYKCVMSLHRNIHKTKIILITCVQFELGKFIYFNIYIHEIKL